MAWKLIISLISMINGDKCRFEHEFLNAWRHATTLLRRFPFLDCLTFVFDDHNRRGIEFSSKNSRETGRPFIENEIVFTIVILFLQRGGKATHFWQQNRLGLFRDTDFRRKSFVYAEKMFRHVSLCVNIKLRLKLTGLDLILFPCLYNNN